VDTAQSYLGTAMADVFNILLLTSLFAAALSFHNVAARYYFNLGNTGVLHSALGRAHHRHRSPAVASLLGSVITGVLVACCALAGLDPMIEVFTWLSSIATVGVMLLMALTSAAVIAFFRRNNVDNRPLQTFIAPALGLVGLVVVVCLLVGNLPFLMGGSTAVAIGAAVVLVGAFIAGMVLSRTRPVLTSAFGQADATTAAKSTETSTDPRFDPKTAHGKSTTQDAAAQGDMAVKPSER
jgi:amino acid transporter